MCSTTSVGDSICRGCKRYAFEVIQWNAYQDEEKESVLRRIEVLTSQIMGDKFHIESVDALKQRMILHKLPFNAALSPYCWINTLLQKAPLDRLQLADFGISVKAPFRHVSVQALANIIDSELLLLCDAHFERYYARVDSLS